MKVVVFVDGLVDQRLHPGIPELGEPSGRYFSMLALGRLVPECGWRRSSGLGGVVHVSPGECAALQKKDAGKEEGEAAHVQSFSAGPP